MEQTEHPVVGMVNQRLFDVRESEGLSLSVWRERLICREYKVSLSAIRNYEEPISTQKQRARMPPLDYIARVAEVFGIRLEWLLYAKEPMRADEMTSDETESLQFAKDLYGEKVRSVLSGVPWLKNPQVKFAFLRLLYECRRAVGDEPDRIKEELPKLLGSLFTLPFQLPGAKRWIAQAEVLTQREKNLVVQHLTSLVYLLFVPFREDHDSRRRSQTLRGG